MRRASLRMGLMSLVSLTSAFDAAIAQTDSNATDRAAADIVAAQLRSQGYACGEPSSAKPDQKASKPDETAWILTCKNATYRVRLVPDMAAQVEQLDRNRQ